MKLKDIKALLNSTTSSPDAVVIMKLKLNGGKRLGKGSQRTPGEGRCGADMHVGDIDRMLLEQGPHPGTRAGMHG